MKRLIAPLTLLLAAASIASAAAWDGVSGPISEIKEPLTAVARTQADWEALWKRHSGGDLKSMPGDLKEGELVVAVFLGERKTAGIKVKLDVIQDPTDASKVVVFYSEVTPSDDAMRADVVSYPFAMIKLPKPYKAVEFAFNGRCKAISGEAVARMSGVADRAAAFAALPRFDY